MISSQFFIKMQFVPHRNTVHRRYKNQPDNAIQGNNRCLL
jgi:hypothetical protein